MDKKQLDQKLKALEDKYNNDVVELKQKYAHANSKFVKGDIVTDDNEFFEIITPYYGSSGDISYLSIVLTKKLKPRKDNERRHLDESRIKAV